MNTQKKKVFKGKSFKQLGILILGILIVFSNAQMTLAQKTSKKSASSIKKDITKRKPNILWITTEGLPLKVLSCYGGTLIQTPNIDRIAKEGMLFQNSFCTNGLCAPSRATLLTGKYSHLNGMLANPGNVTGVQDNYFDAKQETFARILQQNGYKTGIVGKWHLKDKDGKASNPGEAGFDYFVFKNGAGGPYYNPKGFFQNPSLGSKVIEAKSFDGYITDNITNLAIKGIEEMKDGPFMMAVQFFNDHRPFDPPHKYEHIYDSIRFPEPATFWDDYETRSSAAQQAHQRIEDMPDFHPSKDLTPRQRKEWNYQQLMRHFLATLKAQDDNIGRLLDYLDKSGLAKNTIVVFTGDHGFFLGEHGWFDKRFMYEEALRVPWLIRYPNVIKPGTVTDAWVVNIDNAPTILDMAGVKIPADMQGRSLLPIFKGQVPHNWPKSMYYHYYEFGPPHWPMPCYGIRTEKYKLIYYYTINQWELFDLQKDPDEMDNLFLKGGMEIKPGYKEVFKELLPELIRFRKYYKDNTGDPVRVWERNDYN
jgi:arylsulfatase A-like enzyme